MEEERRREGEKEGRKERRREGGKREKELIVTDQRFFSHTKA